MSDFLGFLLIVVSIVLAGRYAWKDWKAKRAEAARIEAEAARIRKENALLQSKIQFVTRYEKINGYRVTRNLGWVRSSTQDNLEKVEDELKLKAARLGANALTRFYFHTDKEKYQAGTGPKGNPYIRNKTVFTGQARAVVVTENGTSQSPRNYQKHPSKKPEFKKFAGSHLVLDGNNIVGGSNWNLAPLKGLIEELRAARLDFHVFFDSGIRRTLDEHSLRTGASGPAEILAEILRLRTEQISVATGRAEADQFIIEYAERKKAGIVSNDNFDDYKSAYPWLKDGDRLLKFQVAESTILVPRLPKGTK